MATAVAVWSLKLEPGSTEPVVPLSDLRITNIALGETLADENGRTSVKLVYIGPSGEEDDEDDSEEDAKDDDDDEDKPGSEEPVSTILCSLTPGKIEQSMLDIILEGDQEYLFESVGKNIIYLTGNYIDQPNRDQPPYNDEDSDDDDEDDAFDLRDVSSDVAVDPNEMDVHSDDDDVHRIEEVAEEEEDIAPVVEAPKPSKKRSRESDGTDPDESKLSKKEKKRLKKLKAENGDAIATSEANGPAEKENKKEKKEKKEEPKRPKLSETKVLSGGVKVADNKIGSGPAAKSGDRVSVRYIGKLQNGKIFDSNTKGKPFQFRLGKAEVIKGWDTGVAGMQAGGERLLTVPPAMGYGNKKQGDIPANSTLIFEVKVVQIS